MRRVRCPLCNKVVADGDMETHWANDCPEYDDDEAEEM
jgi:phage FluMu protein Com